MGLPHFAGRSASEFTHQVRHQPSLRGYRVEPRSTLDGELEGVLAKVPNDRVPDTAAFVPARKADGVETGMAADGSIVGRATPRQVPLSPLGDTPRS